MGYSKTWFRHRIDKVFYNDEEKFNMDGPDNLFYYWSDFRKKEIVLSNRHAGGEGVMVWAALSISGLVSPTFYSFKVNQCEYIKVLEDHILTKLNNFQQVLSPMISFR